MKHTVISKWSSTTQIVVHEISVLFHQDVYLFSTDQSINQPTSKLLDLRASTSGQGGVLTPEFLKAFVPLHTSWVRSVLWFCQCIRLHFCLESRSWSFLCSFHIKNCYSVFSGAMSGFQYMMFRPMSAATSVFHSELTLRTLCIILTLTTVTKGITFFMYFFRDASFPRIPAITLLSGKSPCC